MDGETALRYARTRHQDENDFGRMGRQQRVMVGSAERLAQADELVAHPVCARRDAAGGPRPICTVLDLVALGVRHGRRLRPEPERLAVDLSLAEEFRGGDGAYLLRPKPVLRQRVSALLNPANAAVEVLNGSGADGVARQAAERLRAQRVRVVNVGNAPRGQPETTVEVPDRG